MLETYSVLLVDADPSDRQATRNALLDTRKTHRISEAASLADALGGGNRNIGPRHDVLILENVLPDGLAVSSLDRIRETYPNAAIVIVTGQGNEIVATEALKKGATDYIPKSAVSPESLTRAMDNAVRLSRMNAALSLQREELELFSYTLAHDLKTPLNTISMLCQLAREDAEDMSVREALLTFDDIGDCVTRMSSLIASLERHLWLNQQLQLSTIDLAVCVRQAIADLGFTVTGELFEIEIGPLPTIECNPSEMTQVFQNLIANALKYAWSAPAPKLVIGAAPAQDSQVMIRIADNGPGIPEEKRDYVFKPFHRLQSYAEITGTGLGLATCDKIVKRLNGRIWAEETPGGGSTICLLLPVRQSEPDDGGAE